MSILNREGDGLHSIVLTLARIVAREKAISRDDLINICVPHANSEKGIGSRARATLSRWTSLGLFTENDGQVRMNVDLVRGESVDTFSERLPSICRRLALHPNHALPLWPAEGGITEEGVGLTADLCRGLAWCLAQDIYALPSTHSEIESLIATQIQVGRFIFLNDTRWAGFRTWARFLGFASGDESSFFCDPTVAVHSELKDVIQKSEKLPATEFISRLTERLPVLDSGHYRSELEQVVKPEVWDMPVDGRLSTALSFALRRLKMQGVIKLEAMADAGTKLTLVGQGGRTWESFTHVSLQRETS